MKFTGDIFHEMHGEYKLQERIVNQGALENTQSHIHNKLSLWRHKYVHLDQIRRMKCIGHPKEFLDGPAAGRQEFWRPSKTPRGGWRIECLIDMTSLRPEQEAEI